MNDVSNFQERMDGADAADGARVGRWGYPGFATALGLARRARGLGLAARVALGGVAAALGGAGALAQVPFGYEPNILGLPAVPQPKPGSSAPAAGQRAPAAMAQQPLPPSDARAFLGGAMSIQHSAIEGVGRVVATSQVSYAAPAERQLALQAAAAMQAGVKDACGRQCQPMAMPKPEILPSGQVQVQFVFKPIYSHLSNEQMIALMQGRPLQLTEAQRRSPAAATPPSAPAAATEPAAATRATP